MNIDITELQSLLFADLKNPFGADYFENINIYISKTVICADISFHNGNTSGCHHIDAFSIEELNEKLSAFFKAMNTEK